MPTKRMTDRAAIRRLLLRSRQAADGHMNAIREAEPLTYALVRWEITQYVLDKFLLTGEDLAETDSFDGLTERSLARSMQVSPELVKEFDTAQSCDGATSAMAKKVLLFRSIERALEIEIPAMRSARLRSMEDFSEMIWDALGDSPRWKDRMK